MKSSAICLAWRREANTISTGSSENAAYPLYKPTHCGGPLRLACGAFRALKSKALSVLIAALLSACGSSKPTEPVQLTVLSSGYVLDGVPLKDEAELDAKLQALQPQRIVLHSEPGSASYREIQAAPAGSPRSSA